MPKIRLTYFDLTGRAETTRMIFGVAGIPIEDRRIDREQWQALKPHTPWGTMPILEVDGVTLGQSKAVHRFAATYVGLLGKNNYEAAVADSIVDTLAEIMDGMVPIYWAPDDKKSGLIREYKAKTMAPKMLAMERILKANSKGQYFVGDSLTWADLHFYTTFESAQDICGDVFKSFPKLGALFNKIQNHHRVKAYLSKRESAKQKSDRSTARSSSKMPCYRLTYFDLTGRGETTRILFSISGIDFEDNRVSSEKWGSMKSGTPWGTLPILEVDGKVLGQSRAVHRFAAKKAGLAGKTLVDQAIADSAVDAICDMFDGFGKVFFTPDDQKMKAAKEYEEKTLVPALANLERLLKGNKGGNGFFVGDDLTWADIHFMVCMDMISSILKDALDRTPLLKSLYKRVQTHPKIKAYMGKQQAKK